MRKKICVPLAEGFEEIEAITIIDVLRRAGLEVITLSITEDKTVVGSHKISIIADALFKETDFDQIKMIVLPGGMPGTLNLDNHSGLKDQIIQFNNNGLPLAAICAAPRVFGKLGLLNNKKAVCYPGNEKYLENAEILELPAIDSGQIVTGRGVGAALQFSLLLVEKLVSKQKAEELAKQMLVV